MQETMPSKKEWISNLISIVISFSLILLSLIGIYLTLQNTIFECRKPCALCFESPTPYSCKAIVGYTRTNQIRNNLIIDIDKRTSNISQGYYNDDIITIKKGLADNRYLLSFFFTILFIIFLNYCYLIYQKIKNNSFSEKKILANTIIPLTVSIIMIDILAAKGEMPLYIFIPGIIYVTWPLIRGILNLFSIGFIRKVNNFYTLVIIGILLGSMLYLVGDRIVTYIGGKTTILPYSFLAIILSPLLAWLLIGYWKEEIQDEGLTKGKYIILSGISIMVSMALLEYSGLLFMLNTL